MQSHRSPRQQISKSRAKPYARRPPLARSASIMSTIKNIVTAPLSWFAANEEFEDTPGKRRRAVPRDRLQQESRSVKRQRLGSPSPLSPTQGYLDPPQLLFQSPTKLDSRPQGPTQSTAFSPSVSVNIPSNSQQHQHLGRHTYSPIPTTSYSQHHLSRTMSMDPPQPQPLTSDATMVPLPHSREHSMVPISRDHSVGPTRTPFRMRTTLSPLPSGNEFGPKPPRKERDPSEPPPLTALMSNPIFVKPPPDAHPMQRSLSAQPTLTLGSLARPTRPPSGILFGSQGSSSNSDPSSRPVNASEIALSELAVYRTPLLPTRLRGSSAIPDMFKPKKVHQIVPMRKGKGELPRLGTGEKKSKKDESGKPYSGQGGMKKLLARRKLEAEEEQKKQKSEAMADDNVDNGPMVPETSERGKSLDVSVALPILEPIAHQHHINGRETSSLRVGRTKLRHHLDSTRPNKTKFSAAYEEDELMDQQEDGEETLKPVPIFEAPKGFSFANEAASASNPAAVDEAKQLPISTLPFSLTKSAPVQDFKIKAPAPILAPSSPAPCQSAFSFTPATPATPAAPTPAISLIPPTPQTASKQSDASAPAPTIPNFFSNSLLTKSASTPPPPPIADLFGSPPTPEKGTSPAPEAVSLFSNRVTSSIPKPSLFGKSSRPTPAGMSFFGFPAPTPSVGTTEDKLPAPGLLFCESPTKSIETPVAPSAPLPGRVEHRATHSQPPSLTTGGSLLDGFTTSKPEPTAANASPASSEAVKPSSLSGSTGTATFAGFGAGSTLEPPKPVMTFGQPPAPPIANEPPKPLFGLGPITNNDAKGATKTPFTFGFGTAPPQSSPSKFKFDSIPATPPAEKPASTLFGGAPALAPSPSPMFSFGPANTTITDTSKPFFENNTTRPVTPPKNDQEERMEESPTRSMDTNDKPTPSDFFASRALNFGQSGSSIGASSPFTFGPSSTSSNPFASKPEDKPESRPASSGFNFSSSNGGGFGFGQKEPELSQTSFSSSSSFTFGKPENNAQQTQTSSTSPFGFGAQKLPEINTNASSGGFGFSQKPPVGSQGTSSFGFEQLSPASATTSPFMFGSNQSTIASGFGQQNASAPSSPSTFNQPSPFGFSNPITPSTAPSNPFNFQPSSPVSNPVPNGAFLFGQSTTTTTQSQSPASPFSAPTSPQTAGGALFTIGAAPHNPPAGTRQIKKLPTRRTGKR